jgi:flagellar protein FliT
MSRTARPLPADPADRTLAEPAPVKTDPTAAPPAATSQASASSALNGRLLTYYEAIEQASADMLHAARHGDWDQVVKIEGACVLLISQLKHAARDTPLSAEEGQLKARIMQRILVNDAEIRHLAEPWLDDLDQMLGGKPRTLH